MTPRFAPVLFAVVTSVGLVAQEQAMQPFQYEVTGGWLGTTIDTSPEIEINEFQVRGAYHLHPVSLGSGPWNEAAFLEHSSEIMVQAEYMTFDVSSFSANGFVGGAGFRYADKDTPFAGEFSFSLGSLDGDSGIDIDVSTIEARGGYWLRPNAIVGIDFSREETDAASLLEVEELRVGAFGKIVHDLGEGRSVNGEARIGIDQVDDALSKETNVELEVSGDFYFTPRCSAGARLSESFGDAVSDEGTTVAIRAAAWVSPRVAVSAEFEAFMASDNAGNDSTQVLLELTVRF